LIQSGLNISQKRPPGGTSLNIHFNNARATIILIFPSKYVGPLQGHARTKRYLTHARWNEVECCMKDDSLNAYNATQQKACSINRIHMIEKIWPYKLLTVAIAKRQYLNVTKNPLIRLTPNRLFCQLA